MNSYWSITSRQQDFKTLASCHTHHAQVTSETPPGEETVSQSLSCVRLFATPWSVHGILRERSFHDKSQYPAEHSTSTSLLAGADAVIEACAFQALLDIPTKRASAHRPTALTGTSLLHSSNHLPSLKAKEQAKQPLLENSFMVPWLRACLPTQESKVRSLIRKLISHMPQSN